MSKRGLGKGIHALIPALDDTPLSDTTSDAIDVETEKIQINPNQPRKNFDEESLAELARSVEQHGILQPLIVRPHGDGYEVVAGERRLRAAKMAGLTHVPVLIRTLSDREMMEIALIENLQREDLNPLEEAEAYKRLMEEYNYTQEQVAQRVGKSRSAIANTLRLLSLHSDVRKMLLDGLLTEGHARAILALPLEKQPAAALKVIELNLSVRETERLISEMQKKTEKSQRKKRIEKDRYILDLEERLRLSCGTAVNVRISRSGKGKLEIHFSDLTELERLCEILL